MPRAQLEHAQDVAVRAQLAELLGVRDAMRGVELPGMVGV